MPYAYGSNGGDHMLELFFYNLLPSSSLTGLFQYKVIASYFTIFILRDNNFKFRN
jgi:hypothetical protein